jgi:hypothetical protein
MRTNNKNVVAIVDTKKQSHRQHRRTAATPPAIITLRAEAMVGKKERRRGHGRKERKNE